MSIIDLSPCSGLMPGKASDRRIFVAAYRVRPASSADAAEPNQREVFAAAVECVSLSPPEINDCVPRKTQHLAGWFLAGSRASNFKSRRRNL